MGKAGVKTTSSDKERIRSSIDIEELQLAKMLKVDNDFTPCPVTTGDELFPNGIFEFNITKMLEYIQKKPDGITLEEVAMDLGDGVSLIVWFKEAGSCEAVPGVH